MFMLLKYLIVSSVLAIGLVSIVEAQPSLAQNDSSYYSNSNVNANIWQHDAQSSEEMSETQTALARDRRLHELLPDGSDFKFKNDPASTDDSQLSKNASKKRAHCKSPIINNTAEPMTQNSKI